MDFLPHTDQDVSAMLAALGSPDLEDLFEAIPDSVRAHGELDVPAPLDEISLMAHLRDLAARSKGAAELVCFAGGGSYDHHVPAAVKALASRAEFATSYTPYQPELSQGVLQAIFEFQSLVCELFGMEASNASLYDGASALVEASNLAVRVTGRQRVLVSGALHPHYVDVLRTYTSGLGVEVDVAEFGDGGVPAWDEVDASGAAAIVAGYPNFFGRIEDLDRAAATARSAAALSIAVADPTAMGILAAPGDLGIDVVVGEGHALGNPMSYGGPYVGLFATKLAHVRQVPGRIAGETLDADGRRAFVLTLQAREQHIRRAKATSNVCTNQTLMAIAAAIHLSWLGPRGLHRLGEICVRRAARAAEVLGTLPGCRVLFEGPRFKEIVLETPLDGAVLARRLAERGFLVGPPLGRWFPELTRCLLIAVTEKRTDQDITALAEAIEKEVAEA
ncbi:MAG TPA: aminomethyl-transferring glycine dehydrogenase subunit GcvPA [Actinomycetota bacterium]|nr:aminomethyl-transferring glycine dehydrogenase subunit GcvPA [Actinomycetota bacterium]